MTDDRPNLLVRIWRGFWNGLTAFRMAVFNILFLLVLAWIIRIVFFSGGGVTVEDSTVLVIEPNGMIVEEYTGTPAERAINQALGQELPETRLRDVLRALDLAADDDRITHVLLRTDRLLGIAPGTLTELAAAVERFRESGKPVIAHGSAMLQGSYGFAALADEVWLHPDGMVMVEGYSYFRNYFNEALEKLQVDVHLFRVGEFKSAAEPYIRDSMSEADREAAEYWIGGLWQEYLDLVAAHRGMPVERLAGIVDGFVDLLEQAGGDPSAAALDAGLVDRLMTHPEVRTELAQRAAGDEDGGFRRIGMGDYLALPRPPDLVERKVGIVVAAGPITEGVQPPGTIGSESTSRLLRRAARDDSVHAVVLRIDSGGGSAYASEVIRQEMVALTEAGKPVVVSMGDVAASGGYWIAMGADEVWAYPNTITGSIGIFGLFPTFQDTLDLVGIHTDGFGVTPLAGAFRPDMDLPETAARAIQAIIGHGYEVFIGLVAEHRDMSAGAVRDVASGRVWTGRQARDRGLVDQLGTLEEAVASAARMAGIADEYETIYVQPQRSAIERFLVGMGAEAFAHAGIDRVARRAMPLSFLGGDLVAQFRAIAAASERRQRIEVIAHCACEAPR